MKDLLEFLLKGILGEEKFEIEESEEEGAPAQTGRILYVVKTDPKNIGLVIGKGGKMIQSLRNILKVRATLEKKGVNISIAE